MPDANALTVGVMALMAQHEREAISDRTKAALAAAKARGTKLGGDRGGRASPEARRLGARRNVEAADDYAKLLAPFVAEARADGASSLRGIGARLEAAGVRTRSGRATWSPSAVKALLERIAESEDDGKYA
jgi:DNA invertase Pin-like site-specific DNA recombinase